MGLNSKQKKTLDAIFESPSRSDVLWSDVISLFKALGAEVIQGKGSRQRVRLNDLRAVFHEPHPERETDRGALKSVREFLQSAGIDGKAGEEDRDVESQRVQRTMRG